MEAAGIRPFNRTSVELKLTKTCVIIEAILTFNRTSVELKLVYEIRCNVGVSSFNRTSVELKHGWKRITEPLISCF